MLGGKDTGPTGKRTLVRLEASLQLAGSSMCEFTEVALSKTKLSPQSKEGCPVAHGLGCNPGSHL